MIGVPVAGRLSIGMDHLTVITTSLLRRACCAVQVFPHAVVSFVIVMRAMIHRVSYRRAMWPWRKCQFNRELSNKTLWLVFHPCMVAERLV